MQSVWLTSDEAIRYLRIDRTAPKDPGAAFKRVAYQIPRVRRGRSYLYHLEDLEKWMQQQKRRRA